MWDLPIHIPRSDSSPQLPDFRKWHHTWTRFLAMNLLQGGVTGSGGVTLPRFQLNKGNSDANMCPEPVCASGPWSAPSFPLPSLLRCKQEASVHFFVVVDFTKS